MNVGSSVTYHIEKAILLYHVPQKIFKMIRRVVCTSEDFSTGRQRRNDQVLGEDTGTADVTGRWGGRSKPRSGSFTPTKYPVHILEEDIWASDPVYKGRRRENFPQVASKP